MKYKIKLLVILALLFSIGCKGKTEQQYKPTGRRVDHKKPLAWGHGQTIYVFADDRVWKYAEKPLKDSIERFFYTTENETMFELKRADYKAMDQFYRFKNLIFLGHLESKEEVSSFIKERLTETALAGIDENGAGMYLMHNLWANDQLVVFIMGQTEEKLLRYNIIQAEDTFQSFREVLFQRTRSKIYGLEVYPDSFFKKQPWLIKIPKSYIVYKEDSEHRYLSFLSRKKDNADKYVTVYYEKMEENNVNLAWAVKTREKLAWDVYDEDEIVKEDTRSELTDFKGRKAIKISGKWQNKKYAVGGAFQTFAFYDQQSKKAFFVDNSVFFPEGYKLSSLIELEIISRTIELKE